MRPHAGRVVTAMNGEPLPLDAGFEEAVDGFQEIPAVCLDVEADDVRAEQAFEQLLAPGTDAECLRVRPRDMPEDGDACVGTLCLHHRWKAREVVVLDEEQRLLDALQ